MKTYTLALLLFSAALFVPADETSVPVPTTLPVETELLFSFRPEDIAARMNQWPPYDRRPFPEPWQEMDFDEIGYETLDEARKMEGLFNRYLPEATYRDMVEAGVVLPDHEKKPRSPRFEIDLPADDTRFLDAEISTVNGRWYFGFPDQPGAWEHGGYLHVGDTGCIIWYNCVFYDVSRIEPVGDLFYIYRLSDDGVWVLADFHEEGAKPYRRVSQVDPE